MTTFQSKFIKTVVVFNVYSFLWYGVYITYGHMYGILYALSACWFICTFLEIRNRFTEDTKHETTKAKQANTEVAPWTWGRDVKEDSTLGTSSDYGSVLCGASIYNPKNRPTSTPKSSPVQVGSRTAWETKEPK